MKLPLPILVVLVLAAGFIGYQEGKPRHRSNAVDNFKQTWNLQVGGFATDAPDGSRLLFHHTGDLYEMLDGCWYHLQIDTSTCITH